MFDKASTTSQKQSYFMSNCDETTHRLGKKEDLIIKKEKIINQDFFSEIISAPPPPKKGRLFASFFDTVHESKLSCSNLLKRSFSWKILVGEWILRSIKTLKILEKAGKL